MRDFLYSYAGFFIPYGMEISRKLKYFYTQLCVFILRYSQISCFIRILYHLIIGSNAYQSLKLQSYSLIIRNQVVTRKIPINK